MHFSEVYYANFFFQAIDRFGETCRSIASRLVTLKQIFDKTDLSTSDIQETQHVLEVHGQMWFDVRDDINTAQMTGNTQLKCMKVNRRFLIVSLTDHRSLPCILVQWINSCDTPAMPYYNPKC